VLRNFVRAVRKINRPPKKAITIRRRPRSSMRWDRGGSPPVMRVALPVLAGQEKNRYLAFGAFGLIGDVIVRDGL
jgi:hypothetical protein